PGLAITVAVLGLNLLGDGIREASDPTLASTTGAARVSRTHMPEVVS
ncbi:MAG: ABC transporter permease, partial [Micrococcales bacterium]|nr:ABC transporter permease [Micrococcales bacterium]